MLEVALDAAQTALWNAAGEWKQGLLFGLQQALDAQPDIVLVIVKDNNGAELQSFRRVWQVA